MDNKKITLVIVAVVLLTMLSTGFSLTITKKISLPKKTDADTTEITIYFVQLDNNLPIAHETGR